MKKLLTVLSIMCLATLSFSASDFIKSHRPKTKSYLPIEQRVEQKVLRQMPKPKQATKQNKKMSWRNYLQHLEDAVANFTTYDGEENVHPYLLQLKPSDFAIKDYQELSRYFQETYGVDPQKGTLEQYEEFYKTFNGLSPMGYNVLPTIAIWRTGSIDAIIPFRHQVKNYWTSPYLAAQSYDTMARVDYHAAKQMMYMYLCIPEPSNIEYEENQEQIKEFFKVWRSQEDKTLPSVKDADELEQLVFASEK